MTIQQYRQLSEHTQFSWLLTRGVCIGEHTRAPVRYLLFQIEGFYVEVGLDCHSDEVLTIRQFDNTRELRPYLEQLDLAPILQ